MADPLTVDVVASDQVLWSGAADRVVAPAIEGEIGLLANHEPILSVLAPGSIRVHTSAGENHAFEVAGGFISFDHNVITAVVDPVAPPVEE